MPGLSKYGPKQSDRKDLPPLMKAEDFKAPKTFTVASAEERKMKGEQTLILGFKETEAQMVVNATNATALAEKFGDVEPKELIGKQITLASVPTTYEGKATKGIRVVG